MLFKNTVLVACLATLIKADYLNTLTDPSTTETERSYSTVEPNVSEIAAAQATAVTNSETSNVEGAAFSRFIQIWFENIDFNATAKDPNWQFWSSQGITLTNYFGVSHPSQENYMAVVGGDFLGLDNDNFITVPSNVSTVVDLLDTKDISWAEYQEDLPYTGFQGFNYSNQETFANAYMRKHNPLILYDSITENATRLANIKNFTLFESDISNQKLPQWSFVTPNMTNDAHDTNITFASNWAREWLAPKLNNSYFTNDTLILLTFDETSTYPLQNRVYSVLLGGAVPKELWGTTDDTFYTHYSCIASIEDNFNLPNLGRYDSSANVFEIVANKTGHKNTYVNSTYIFNNETYNGYYDNVHIGLPAPNVTAIGPRGNGVLPSIVSTWKDAWDQEISANSSSKAYYNMGANAVFEGAALGIPEGVVINVKALNSTSSNSTSSSNSSSSSNSTSGSTTSVAKANGAGAVTVENSIFVGLVALVVQYLV